MQMIGVERGTAGSEVGQIGNNSAWGSSQESLQDYMENIEDAFKKGDIETARAEVAHMKYYANILDKIIEIEMIHIISKKIF